MVSSYDETAQAKWLADAGIELIRGNGRILDRGVVEVDGAVTGQSHRHRNGIRTGDPAHSGLAGLDGVWTNREATGAREILTAS